MIETEAIETEEEVKYFDELMELKPKDFEIYVPKFSKLGIMLRDARLEFTLMMNAMPSYFVMRHKLSRTVRHSIDMVFIIHYTNDHLSENTKGSFTEKMNYQLLYRAGYGKELFDSWSKFDKKKNRTKREQKFHDIYIDQTYLSYLEMRDEDDFDRFHNYQQQ